MLIQGESVFQGFIAWDWDGLVLFCFLNLESEACENSTSLNLIQLYASEKKIPIKLEKLYWHGRISVG